MDPRTPSPEWAAEIEVTEPLVRRLLAGQFPGLAGRAVRQLATGWDNSVWLVGDEVVFRFPRRAIAVAGVEREIASLTELAPRLPLPIPVPAFVGRPGPGYPWPFFGAAYVPGREPAEAALDGRRATIGGALGGFLRALHAPAVRRDLAAGLPRDPMGRADMAARVPRTRERIADVEALGLWRAGDSVGAILEAATALGPATGQAVVHGDLHVRHLVIDDAGALAGVIDWGDLGVGDPSIDLSLYWSLLDAAGREAFRAAYGGLSAEQLLRARVLALFLNAALAAYAAGTGNARLLAETVAGLDRTLDPGPGIRPAGAS